MRYPTSNDSMSKPPSSANVTAAEPRETAAAPRPGAFWFPLLVETVIFCLVFALVLLALRPGRPASVAAVAAAPLSVWSFLAAFAAATVLFILLTRSARGSRWFAALFALAVFIGVAAAADVFFGPATAVLAASAAVLAYYGWKRVIVFDLVLVLGLAGVAIDLGAALQPTGTAVILALLSVYDIVAVFFTRHMVTGAEALLRQKALFAIIIPSAPAGFWRRSASVEPGRGFLIMGTGDLVLPALLVAAAGRYGLVRGLAVALGAIAGLVSTHLIFMAQRRRRPIPALPPIALGAIIGYLFTLIFVT